MMLFQWLTIPVLGLLFVLECVGVVRRGRATWIGVLRSIIWLAAATAIAYPDLTGVIANAVAAALASLGVEPRGLPLTPSRVWEMIRAAPAKR